MRFLVRHFLFIAIAFFALTATAEERITYFVPNAQGSPVAAMDRQGSVVWRESYAPYGERLSRLEANNARAAYAGKPEDQATGLVYMGARWYDPETARFTGVDPQGFRENDIQSFGRYGYADASPYRYVDPDGESPVDAIFLAYDAATFAAAVYSGSPVAMWESGADLAASFLGVASPFPGTGQAIKAVRAAEKAREGGRVFWSGGRPAREAAEKYAKDNGKRTLEMSPKGRWLEAHQEAFPKKDVGTYWSEISKGWAGGATGEVDVFIHRPQYSPSRTWAVIEKPSLLQNVDVTKIIYHDVK